MRAGKMSRRLAAMTLLASVTAGCSPDPAPTPAPPPPVSQTPTESAQEMQQRVDYEAAEKAYRTFRGEYNRVLRAGGSNKPTQVMNRTAGDGYLEDVQRVAEAYKGLHYHQAGEEKVTFVKRGGYSTSSIALDVCEDTSSVRTLNNKGNVVGRGEMRRLRLEIERRSGSWKIWSGSGKQVDSCE